VGDGLMGFGATILFINLFSGFISKKKSVQWFQLMVHYM